jgi:hypothetical protein
MDSPLDPLPGTLDMLILNAISRMTDAIAGSFGTTSEEV